MRHFGIVVVSAIFVVGLLIANGSSSAKASDYHGELCWTCDRGGIVSLGFTSVGGGHFLVNGQTDNESLHGNAEFINGKIKMGLVQTWAEGHGNFQMVLDPSTLNGTYSGIDIEYDSKSKTFNKYFFSGTMTFVPCP